MEIYIYIYVNVYQFFIQDIFGTYVKMGDRRHFINHANFFRVRR